LLAIGLVGVVLLQRSEGGALGIGGGGGVLTGRAAGNLLTRTTAVLAALFFTTSLVLAVVANGHNKQSETPFDKLPTQAPAAGFPQSEAPQPAQPAAPLGK
jgi:preprotein translocase subunit SecG